MWVDVGWPFRDCRVYYFKALVAAVSVSRVNHYNFYYSCYYHTISMNMDCRKMSFWGQVETEGEVCIHLSKTPYNLCLIISLVSGCLNKNELHMVSCIHSRGIKSPVRANFREASWFCHSFMSVNRLLKWSKVCNWSTNYQV